MGNSTEHYTDVPVKRLSKEVFLCLSDVSKGNSIYDFIASVPNSNVRKLRSQQIKT